MPLRPKLEWAPCESRVSGERVGFAFFGSAGMGTNKRKECDIHKKRNANANPSIKHSTMRRRKMRLMLVSPGVVKRARIKMVNTMRVVTVNNEDDRRS